MTYCTNVFRSVFLFAALSLSIAPAKAQFSRQPPPPSQTTNVYATPGGKYSGNLQGSANVITAQSQYMLDTQQAYLKQEEVKRSKTDTKRKAYDEWQYEQAHTPSTEDVREKQRKQEVERSRNNPPVTEIWSAKALNDLLSDMQRLSTGSVYARSEPLDPTMLRRINVNTGKTNNGVGLLREPDQLRWPLTLKEKDFDKDRKQVDQLVAAAVKQAKAGAVQPGPLRDLIATVARMRENLKAKASDIPTNQYIDAKRFLDELNESTKVLQDPNVANYFNGKWEAKGNTVGELVQNMTRQGLRFAPVSGGDETNYTSLHRSMANYDVALNQQAGKR